MNKFACEKSYVDNTRKVKDIDDVDADNLDDEGILDIDIVKKLAHLCLL